MSVLRWKNVNAYRINKYLKPVLGICLFVLFISMFLYSYIDEMEKSAIIQDTVNSALTQENDKNSNIEEKDDESDNQKITFDRIREYFINLSFLKILKDFLVVAVSIVISSLLTTVFIEKKNKNEIYAAAFTDFLGENNCVLNISDLSEDNVQFYNKIVSKNIPIDLVGNVLGKISTTEGHYYYNDYNIEIKCEISKNVIIKKIRERINLRSYNDSYKFDKDPFIISEMICEKLHSIKENSFEKNNIEIKRVEIVGDYKDLSKYVKYDSNSQSNKIHKKMGYNKSYRALLNYNFTIYKETDTELIIEYTTRVPLKDKMFILHFPCACRRAIISFSLNGNNARRYKVYGGAFGFIDNAENTFNDNSPEEISFEFRNWSFKGDGVAIGIIKKSEKDKKESK